MQDLGHGETLTYAPWPVADESLLVEDTVNLPVQASLSPTACEGTGKGWVSPEGMSCCRFSAFKVGAAEHPYRLVFAFAELD